MGSSPSQWLRLGVLLGDRLVEERLCRPRQALTVGSSPRCTLSVPAAGLPRRWRLFELRRGRRELRLAPAMEARWAGKDGALTAAGRAAGAQARIVPLAPGTRGKVVAGEVTVLFQLIAPPPERPRPRLPSSVRGGPLTGADWFFTSLGLASLLAHLTLVLYLRGVDWPRRPDPETLGDHFVTMVVRRPPPPPAAPATTPVDNASASAATAKPRKPARPPAPAISSDERRRQLAAAVQSQALLKVLTSKGGASNVADLLGAGDVDRAQEEAFRNVTGLSVATSESLRGMGPRSGSTGRVAEVGGLRDAGGIAAPTSLDVGGERKVASVIKVDPAAVESGSADPVALAAEIRRRLSAIRACYERALRRSPRLGGKLVLRFTIAAAGTVTAVDFDEDTIQDGELSRCLRELALRWRFPPPQAAPVEITFPFVFQPLE
jgi:hypothetical protein